MEYVIGCDVGSQGTKAMLLGLDGTLGGEASASYAIDYPHPLWAEQPPERWVDALTTAIGRLMASTGVPPERVRALGLATQVDGVVPIDSNGQPLRPAIIWMDRRAAGQCEQARRIMPAERAFQLTGLNLDASHVAPKIRWIAENQPDISSEQPIFYCPAATWPTI